MGEERSPAATMATHHLNILPKSLKGNRSAEY
jgi:hypothetical protein